MNHTEIADKLKKWLDNKGWPCGCKDNDSTLYFSIRYEETGLSADIRVRIFDDGWYRVYAFWPAEIDGDMKPLVEYVAKKSSETLDYGRLKVSCEEKTVYYVSDVCLNNISELTDEIISQTITLPIVRLTETYGADIVALLNKNEDAQIMR